MTELLALPTVAAMPAAIGPAMLDAASSATATSDLFAAFLASAQVAPPAQSGAGNTIKLPATFVAEDEGTAVDFTSLDENPTEPAASEAPSAAPQIDPGLSPALAMLAALVAPAVAAPRMAMATSPRALVAGTATAQPHPQPLPQAAGVDIGQATAEGEIVLAIQANSKLPESESITEVPMVSEAETIAPAIPRSARPIPMRALSATEAKDSAVAATPHRAEPVKPATTPLLRVADGAPDALRAAPIIPAAPALPVQVLSADGVPQTPATDLLVQRQLVIAEDGRWLDSLARDIARSASGETIRFRLEPVNLGSLTVAIAQASDGTAIRMTAETHRARDLLVEAQPALVAEARANGLRISETHIDLSSGNRDGNTPTGGQPSFANASTGQQAMRQDGNARRQPDLPAPAFPQTRSPAAAATVRDSEERFA